MSKNSIIEMIIFISFAFGSSYFFDIGLWGFLVGILAAALFKTVKKY
jgi:predicted PurR-regulated permease PerM